MTITLSGSSSQTIQLAFRILNAVRTPDVLLLQVWPLPLSLATTSGISFDFSSSGYLDVSVPQVPLVYLFDSVYDPWFFIMGVPTFGNLRINAYLQLPAAYRSLSRPSSAPNAKAFSICSSSLELLLYIWRYTIGSRFSRLNCCVFHTCSLRLFIVFGKIVSFLPFTEKPDFNSQILLCCLWFLVSLYFCLSCMSHLFFKESICHFSYSVFNEHSFQLNSR